MSTNFEIPSHGALLTEQAAVQAEKFQGRLLDEYSNYIFPGQGGTDPRGSAIVDFVRPITGDTEEVTLDKVLDGLLETRPKGSVHWVDMGGGYALAMRQVGATIGRDSRLRMTNVDLLDCDLEGLAEDKIAYYEGLVPGIAKSEAAPVLITDNIETVTLPEPADVITSVETVQYLNDPLKALSNMYNQLADNGIMFVAADHDWPGWISYSGEQDETPMKHVLEELTRAGINYAVTDESDGRSGVRPDVDPNCFRRMAIQKKPGTLLRVTKSVTEVWKNHYHYKIAYYEAPTTESSPVIEVVDVHTALGALSLENV